MKLVAEKKLYDGKKLSSEQWEERTEMPVAPGWVLATISCLDDGWYTPSEYAEQLGLKEIQEYLEGLGI